MEFLVHIYLLSHDTPESRLMYGMPNLRVVSVRGDTWIYKYPSVTVLHTIRRSLLSGDFSVTVRKTF